MRIHARIMLICCIQLVMLCVSAYNVNMSYSASYVVCLSV